MDEKLKQKLIEAVKAGDENQASELLWQLVIDCQNCPFKTVSGLPFSYTIKRGRNGELTKELWIDRRENSKSLAWSSIRPVSYTHLDVYKRQVTHRADQTEFFDRELSFSKDGIQNRVPGNWY